MVLVSAVIDDLNVSRFIVGPYETDAELAIDTDTVLARPIILQRLQVIAKSFSTRAASSIASFRLAIASKAPNRLILRRSYSARVSLHRKSIIGICHSVYRYTVYSKRQHGVHYYGQVPELAPV